MCLRTFVLVLVLVLESDTFAIKALDYDYEDHCVEHEHELLNAITLCCAVVPIRAY